MGLMEVIHYHCGLVSIRPHTASAWLGCRKANTARSGNNHSNILRLSLSRQLRGSRPQRLEWSHFSSGQIELRVPRPPHTASPIMSFTVGREIDESLMSVTEGREIDESLMSVTWGD